MGLADGLAARGGPLDGGWLRSPLGHVPGVAARVAEPAQPQLHLDVPAPVRGGQRPANRLLLHANQLPWRRARRVHGLRELPRRAPRLPRRADVSPAPAANDRAGALRVVAVAAVAAPVDLARLVGRHILLRVSGPHVLSVSRVSKTPT